MHALHGQAPPIRPPPPKIASVSSSPSLTHVCHAPEFPSTVSVGTGARSQPSRHQPVGAPMPTTQKYGRNPRLPPTPRPHGHTPPCARRLPPNIPHFAYHCLAPFDAPPVELIPPAPTNTSGAASPMASLTPPISLRRWQKSTSATPDLSGAAPSWPQATSRPTHSSTPSCMPLVEFHPSQPSAAGKHLHPTSMSALAAVQSPSSAITPRNAPITTIRQPSPAILHHTEDHPSAPAYLSSHHRRAHRISTHTHYRRQPTPPPTPASYSPITAMDRACLSDHPRGPTPPLSPALTVGEVSDAAPSLPSHDSPHPLLPHRMPPTGARSAAYHHHSSTMAIRRRLAHPSAVERQPYPTRLRPHAT